MMVPIINNNNYNDDNIEADVKYSYLALKIEL